MRGEEEGEGAELVVQDEEPCLERPGRGREAEDCRARPYCLADAEEFIVWTVRTKTRARDDDETRRWMSGGREEERRRLPWSQPSSWLWQDKRKKRKPDEERRKEKLEAAGCASGIRWTSTLDVAKLYVGRGVLEFWPQLEPVADSTAAAGRYLLCPVTSGQAADRSGGLRSKQCRRCRCWCRYHCRRRCRARHDKKMGSDSALPESEIERSVGGGDGRWGREMGALMVHDYPWSTDKIPKTLTKIKIKRRVG